MTLKMNPLVSRLLRGAAVAVLFAVAPGCGAPMEEELETPAQVQAPAPVPATAEAPAVHAQDLPTYCDPELEYFRMLCQSDCSNYYSDCMNMCNQDESADPYLCPRSCGNDWNYCLELCDKKYC
jgi:predicted secreted protein